MSTHSSDQFLRLFEAAGWSQSELARQAGVSRSLANAVINGVRSPNEALWAAVRRGAEEATKRRRPETGVEDHPQLVALQARDALALFRRAAQAIGIEDALHAALLQLLSMEDSCRLQAEAATAIENVVARHEQTAGARTA